MPSTRSKAPPKKSKTRRKDHKKHNTAHSGDIKAGISLPDTAKKRDLSKNSSKTHLKQIKRSKPDKPAIQPKIRQSPNAFLSKEEEAMVADWVVESYSAGFLVSEDQVLNSLQYLLTELGKETPFPYNRPNRKWFDAFLQRNPQISERVHRRLPIPVFKSQEQIEEWFEQVSTHLLNINLFDVLKDPDRIFNGEELGFFINPHGNKAIFKRSAQKAFQIVNIDQRIHVGIFFSFSASGRTAPPMMISQHSSSVRCFQEMLPVGWSLGISENGWMTGKTFFEYLVNVFSPWLDANNIHKPVVLFFNNRTTHLTLQLSHWCWINGIILIGVLPNDPYLMQPIDVSILSVLRRYWLFEANRVRKEDKSGILKVSKFCSTLQKVMDDYITPELIQTGFQKCGFFPWDPSSANKESLIKNFEANETVIDDAEDYSESKDENGTLDPGYKLVLKILEGEIGDEKVKSFYALKNKTKSIKLLDPSDVSLFQVWKEIVSKAENVQGSWVPESYCEVVIKEI